MRFDCIHCRKATTKPQSVKGAFLRMLTVLHHPALEIGGWQDLKILKNRDKFREIIESSEYVRIVLAGHIHEFTDRTLNGIRYSTAPGLGFAFSSKLT